MKVVAVRPGPVSQFGRIVVQVYIPTRGRRAGVGPIDEPTMQWATVGRLYEAIHDAVEQFDEPNMRASIVHLGD